MRVASKIAPGTGGGGVNSPRLRDCVGLRVVFAGSQLLST